MKKNSAPFFTYCIICYKDNAYTKSLASILFSIRKLWKYILLSSQSIFFLTIMSVQMDPKCRWLTGIEFVKGDSTCNIIIKAKVSQKMVLT